jgi:hypothetical protein
MKTVDLKSIESKVLAHHSCPQVIRLFRLVRECYENKIDFGADVPHLFKTLGGDGDGRVSMALGYLCIEYVIKYEYRLNGKLYTRLDDIPGDTDVNDLKIEIVILGKTNELRPEGFFARLFS